MKRSIFRRPLALLLAGLLAAGLLPAAVSASAEPAYSWTAGDVAVVVTDRDAEFLFENETVLGGIVHAAPWEIFFNGSLWTGPLPDVSGGDTLRVEVDFGLQTPSSNAGAKVGELSLFNSHVGYQSAVAAFTLPAYNALPEKTDETYGFTYRTLTQTVTLPEDEAVMENVTAGGGLSVKLNNSTSLGGNGRTVYRVALVDETLGRTVFEITGQDVLDAIFTGGGNYYPTPVTVVDGVREITVGSAVTDDDDEYDWWGYVDLMAPALTGVEAGDTLRFNVKVFYPEGVEGNGTGLFIRSHNDSQVVLDKQVPPGEYENADLLVDEECGFEYKDQYIDLEIEDPELVSTAMKIFIGAPNNNYRLHPMEVYGFSITNVSTEEVLVDFSGAQVSAGSWAQGKVTRTDIVETFTDPSRASKVVFGEETTGDVAGPISLQPALADQPAGVYRVVLPDGLEAALTVSDGDAETAPGSGDVILRDTERDLDLSLTLRKPQVGTVNLDGMELLFVRDIEEGDANYTALLADAKIRKVIDLTDALPAEDAFTLDNEEALEAAEAARDALPDDLKALLPSETVDKLTALRQSADAIRARLAELNRVNGLIEALPDAITLADAEAVAAAKEAFDGTDDTTRAQISEENQAKLAAAVAAIADLTAAKDVEDAIAALAADATDEEIAAVQAAFDALTPAQQELVSQEAKDKLAAALPPAFTPGDINGDGAVNASDALLALQHSVKLITLEEDKALAADVSGDGAINAADALLILQYSVKLIDRFPVETV